MSGGYRLGIIGLGRVAWLMERDPLRGKPCTHWGAWSGREEVALVAVCDNDPARLAEFAEAHPDVACYGDYREMLAGERLDLLSVCAYATERCEMVVAAAESGVRGIWCEKAMATSLDEARRMEAALENNGVAMAVAFMRRWDTRYHTVKALLEEGAIGRLESVNLHFPSNLLHTGTHAFDVLRLWCGEVETAQAWLDADSANAEQSGYRYAKGAPGQDAGGFALLEFADGVRATVHGRLKEYFRFEFELLGSEGMIRIGNTQSELWQVAASKRFTGFRELEPAPFPKGAVRNAWSAVVTDLIAAVEGGPPPKCGAADGRQALAIALACHVSHRHGHRPVTLDEVPADLRVPSR